jgi:ABC-2 type transport system ATP-binding protein
MNGPAHSGDYAIDVRGLTKIYNDRPVVNDVTLRVPKGKIYGFLGPNGSGKTTTIRMLCGLLTPDAGDGVVLGHDLRRNAAKIRNATGYMTQKFSYWEDLSIRENLEFVAAMYGLERPKERVDEALEHLNLTARAKQMAGTLSGGWKQRLALAACVMHNPDLLLLDEPTAGVDPKARREFWDEIHRLADNGLTVLVSTHYMDEAERCHAIIYMAYGKLITEGTVTEVIDHAGLTTWTARRIYDDVSLIDLMKKLEKDPAISTVAPFGDSLHISGTDPRALEIAIAPYRADEGLAWVETQPTLEDVFIHYMSTVQDNFT